MYQQGDRNKILYFFKECVAAKNAPDRHSIKQWTRIYRADFLFFIILF